LINKSSKIPLYLQLMDELIKMIHSKNFKENDRLPSERELCDMFDLSRITVRQALQELEREGYIYRVHGKGTFVAPKSYNQRLVKLYTFTDEMKKLGKHPKSIVLAFSEMIIDEVLANKVGFEPRSEVFKIKRLRLADEEPLMYETTYLPKKIFPSLTATDLVEKPMYDVFLEDYQVKVTRAVERFTATLLREDEAKYLKGRPEQPAILLRRYAYFNQQLIEYTVSVVRGDKFEYTVELT